MEKRIWVVLLLIQGMTFAGIVQGQDLAALRGRAQRQIGVLKAQMPGTDKDTPSRIELGKKLYFETLLSSDQKMSCNTCHILNNQGGGADEEATSLGVVGKRGGRNSPTTLNAGYQFAQFWDGRAATLEEQAKGPILNPIEMNMPDEKLVLERLNKHDQYPGLFKTAFPEDAQPLNYDNLARAIAAFERTLITHDRFDDFLKGDDKALSAQELKGLDAFFKNGCSGCHGGPLLGGNRYAKMGQAHPYADVKDLGRYEVTKDEADKYKFKTPMLRNIAITKPYFHDGKSVTLEDAVAQMAWLQSDKKLAADETADIVAFLKALTDKERVK